MRSGCAIIMLIGSCAGCVMSVTYLQSVTSEPNIFQYSLYYFIMQYLVISCCCSSAVVSVADGLPRLPCLAFISNIPSAFRHIYEVKVHSSQVKQR